MAEVTIAKAADLSNMANHSLKTSNKSDTGSDCFESCLKNCSSSNNTNDTNVNSSNSSNTNDTNVNSSNSSNTNDKIENDSKDENDSTKSNSGKDVSRENVLKSNKDDKKVKSETKIEADSDKSDDGSAAKEIDAASLLSMLLDCYKDGSFDLTKLKGELQKLNIPENSQKVIIDFVSQLQDSLKGKSADEFAKLFNSNVNKQSTLKGHDELINNIIDVLKSKLSETYTKLETNKSSIPSLELSSKVAVNSKIEQNNSSNSVTQDAKDSSGKNNLQDSIKSYNQNTLSGNNENFGEDSQNADTDSKSTDEFLQKLISNDKDDDKFSKVSTFMNQFSNVNANVQTVKGEVQVINRNSFSADIVKSVQYMQDNNIKELTVKINPKELGEVVIRLSMENDIMKASISAKNKETYALLQSSLGDINNSLDNQNIKVQAFSVNIYNDTTYFAGQGNSENKQNNGREQDNNSRNKEKTAEVKTESEDLRVDEGKVNMLA